MLAAGLAVFAWRGLARQESASGSKESGSAGTDADQSQAPKVRRATKKAKRPSASKKNKAAGTNFLSQANNLNEILAGQDPVMRSMQFGRLFAEWYAKDSEGALAYLKKMPRGSEFNSALFMALADIAKKDPRRALALARGLAVSSEERVVYNVIFDQLAADNAQEAVKFLKDAPEGECRVNAVRALAIRWADQDIEAALGWARGLDDPAIRGPALESVLFELAEADPWRTFAVAVENLSGDELERNVARVLKELKAIDPEKAGTLVRLLPPGETQTHASLDIARALADRSPALALEWGATLPSEELQQLVLHNVLDVWMGSAPAGACDYVLAMPAGPAQERAAAHLAENLAVQDSAAAIAFAERLQDAAARQAALVAAASGWARRDAGAATRWAVGLGESASLRADAMDATLSYWVLSDSDAAVRYVRRLAAGAVRDDALDTLSTLLSVQQPELAMDLASAIGSPKLRNGALTAVYAEWVSRDPDAAGKWLGSAEVTPADRRIILGD